MPWPTDPASEFFGRGLWGWDGTRWRKLPLLWGFTEKWDENLGGVAAGATYSASTSAVPADEVWILQACSIRNATRAMTGVSIDVSRASGASVFLAFAANVAIYVPLLATGMFVLVAGDLVNLYAGATLAGDTINAGVVGYKMAVE